MQQLGARAGPAPGHAAQPHGHPVSSPPGAALPWRPVPSLSALASPAASLSARLGKGSRRHPAPLCETLQAGVVLGKPRGARPGRFSAARDECVQEPPPGPASLQSKSFRVPRRAPRGPGAELLQSCAVPREDASKHAVG